MRWLLLRNPSPRPLVEGELYEYPLLIADTVWYYEGTVYKIIRKAEGMDYCAPEAVDKKSISQVLCDMINDLPLEVLPKYLNVRIEGGYYFSHLVKHRLRHG